MFGLKPRQRTTETWTEQPLSDYGGMYIATATAKRLRRLVAELDDALVPDEADVTIRFGGNRATWDRKVAHEDVPRIEDHEVGAVTS